MPKKKSVLITGASGFIGRHLCIMADANGYRVIPTIRKGSENKLVKLMYMNPFYLDLLNGVSLEKDLALYEQKYGSIDYVIHAAGIHRTQKLSEFQQGNEDFSRLFYQALTKLEKPISKYVYVSSMAAQGAGDPNTMKPLHEDDSCRPVSPYGKSKRDTELFLQQQQNPNWLIFRPTAVYGPGDHNFPKLFNLLAKGIDVRIGSVKRKISLVHVKDLAGVIITSLSTNNVNKIYNVSDGQAYSQEEFHKEILSKIGRKAIKIQIPQSLAKGIGHLNSLLGKIRGRVVHLNAKKIQDLCAMNWVVDISAMRKDFDFEARYSLDEGLKEAVEDFLEEGK